MLDHQTWLKGENSFDYQEATQDMRLVQFSRNMKYMLKINIPACY